MVNEVPHEVPCFPVPFLIASELCTETQKGGLRLGGQGTDILSYFYYHHVLDVSHRPKPSFVQHVVQTYN